MLPGTRAPKDADEQKVFSGRPGGQREKALGSFPAQGPVCFISEIGSFNLTVSHNHNQCLNTVFCIWVFPRCNLTFLCGDVQIQVG